MVFVPHKLPGLLWGALAWLLSAALTIGSAWYVLSHPPSGLRFLALLGALLGAGLFIFVGYAWYGLARGQYRLDADALRIDWGTRREIIPLKLVTGARLAGDLTPVVRLRGVSWPGHQVGRTMAHPDLGEVDVFATARQAQWVLIATGTGWIAVSPPDPMMFLEALTMFQSQTVEAAGSVERESWRRGLLDWPVWRDRLAVSLLAVAGLSCLTLIGYLTMIYPQLPAQIALHFNAQGAPNRFGAPERVFILPGLGGLALLVNTLWGGWLYRRELERVGAYLLFSVSVLVQFWIWVAVVGVLTAGR